MSVTLGIDIGTSGTKTIAIDESGAILASASAEYPCDHPKPGWSEQDPRIVVEGDSLDHPPDPRQGRNQAGRRCRHRPERPDAWLGLPRRRRQGRPPRLAPGTTSGRSKKPPRSRPGPGVARGWSGSWRTAPSSASRRPRCSGSATTSRPILIGFARSSCPRITSGSSFREPTPPRSATRRGPCSSTSPTVDGARSCWNCSDSILRSCADCFESHEVSAVVGEIGAGATGLKAGTKIVGGGGDQPAGAVGNGIVRAGVVSATMGTSARRLRPRPRARLRPASVGSSAVATRWPEPGA